MNDASSPPFQTNLPTNELRPHLELLLKIPFFDSLLGLIGIVVLKIQPKTTMPVERYRSGMFVLLAVFKALCSHSSFLFGGVTGAYFAIISGRMQR